MESSQKTPVGVIGLGIIGSRIAAALRREGYSVSVWSRSPRAEPNFLSSAREVAESADILQIFVRDGEALLEVIRSMGTALGDSHIVMNHATVGPAETLEAARLVNERGAAFLDAPFTGSRDAAAEGELVYYIGGEESVLERAVPILKASAKAILLMGPVGAATYVKIATNMISAAEIGVLSEALALLARGGIPLPRLLEALQHNVASSGAITAKLPMMLTGDFAPRFSVKNMLKDLQIALRSVEGKGIDLPVTAATAGSLMGAVQAGWGEDDFASMARHYEYAGSMKDLPDQTPLVPVGDSNSKKATGNEQKAKATKGVNPKVGKTKFFGLFDGSKNS
jgi:3-hydroxyisobutyrate dehydrogenase-like beta-hydroxyacid dehydrogenase